MLDLHLENGLVLTGWQVFLLSRKPGLSLRAQLPFGPLVLLPAWFPFCTHGARELSGALIHKQHHSTPGTITEWEIYTDQNSFLGENGFVLIIGIIWHHARCVEV